jgi:hypothetical protein
MEIQAIRADYVETASSEDGAYALIQFKLPDGQEQVLGIPTNQLPSLVHAAAAAYTLNRKLLGEEAGRKPAFKVSRFHVETDAGGYVLTLTIGGGAKLAFHFDRDGLDRMAEVAQAVTGSVVLERPRNLNLMASLRSSRYLQFRHQSSEWIRPQASRRLVVGG